MNVGDVVIIKNGHAKYRKLIGEIIGRGYTFYKNKALFYSQHKCDHCSLAYVVKYTFTVTLDPSIPVDRQNILICPPSDIRAATNREKFLYYIHGSFILK